MSKLKRLVAVVLAGAMSLAMSVSAFAATGITAKEQTILDAAKQKAIELGVDVNTSAKYKEYMAQATSYLTQNELSDTQVDAMVNAVNQAAATVKSDLNGKSLGDLSAAEYEALYKKVADQIVAAADAVGIKVTLVNGSYIVSNLDESPVADNKGPIKQTGAELAADQVNASVSVDTTANMTTTVAMVVMFVGAIAVCGVVAKKKDLFSNVEA